MKTKLIIIALLIFSSCSKTDTPTPEQPPQEAGAYTAEFFPIRDCMVNYYLEGDQQTVDFPILNLDTFYKITLPKCWVGDKIRIVVNSDFKVTCKLYRNDVLIKSLSRERPLPMELTVICY